MGTKSEEEAKKTDYSIFVAPRPYSFELDMDMLGLLRKEFDPPIIVAKIAEAISGKKGKEVETIAEKFFGEYGRALAQKILQLGEEYQDRTYEVLREAADKTGELVFPLIVQRFIEIAYLSTQQFRILQIVENWAQRLVYRIGDCYMFKTLREQAGPEITGLLPCRHACLALCHTTCLGLNLDAIVHMDATVSRDDFCQFSISRI